MEMQERLADPLRALSFNKLMAARELVVSDAFYHDLPSFIRLCNALYNGTISPQSFDPADAAEIAWGLTEALLIWPPDKDDEEPFAQKILEYIGAALADEGIMQPPDILRLGIMSGQAWEKAQMSFSDDPSMFNAIFDIEQEKTAEINALVKQRLRTLLLLLEELPLDTGDAKEATKQLLTGLRSSAQQGSEVKPV